MVMNYLSVSDAAVVLKVSPDTIRRWEKQGLIRCERSKDNHRLFDVVEMQLLHNKLRGDHSLNRYKILTSTEKPEKPYTAIDLFAGAGGTALGMSNAGISHKMLVENDTTAAATLKLNKPDWNVVCEDVAKVDFREYKGKVDIIEGGFPCQTFSYAGRGAGFSDTRGTLFFEFARAVSEARPKIAIGENVKGLLRHDGGKTLDVMLSALKDIGYKPYYKVLRSQYLDVPQKRERLIIVAIRNDLDIVPLLPKEKNYTVSLREAFAGVPESPGQAYPEKKAKFLKLVPPGGCWRDLPADMQKEFMGKSFYLGGGKTGMARRLSWDEPSLTLTCSPAQKQTERCHPVETRPLTVREYARIQTFPDNWIFEGSVTRQYKQIGNAVPVNLGYYLGMAANLMLDGIVEHPDFERID